MTNKERQLSLERQRLKKYGDISACGLEPYCEFCNTEKFTKEDCCAKAYTRMIRKNMKKIVYLAVTLDKYELPIALFENWKEASVYSGKNHKSFNSSVCRQSVDHKNNCRYVSVKLENDEISKE